MATSVRPFNRFLRTYPEMIGGSVVLIVLYLISLYRYVLFHSLAEMFSIVIACGVFVVYWNSRRFLSNSYFLFVGIAYLCVGCIDLLHTLAYKGMGVFPGDDGNIANQLWIAARYLESLSFVAACIFLHRRLNAQLIASGYTAIVTLILGSIFLWGIFPDCFIAGVGVTPFKTTSEVAICGILVASIFLLVRQKTDFDQRVFHLLLGSLIVTIASELSFSYYTNPYGLANLLGHLFKLVSFYLLYKAFIEEGLKRPYDLIFRDLRQATFCLEQAGDCIFWINPEGRIVFANQRACEVLEYSKEELQAMTVFDIDAEISREWWKPHWEAIQEKKSFILESCHRTKTGRVFPVEVAANYMTCDGKEYNCAFARDISKRKKAEEQLAHSSAIVNSSQDAIMGLTVEGCITSWNPAAERLFGYAAEEVLGLSISVLWPPDKGSEGQSILNEMRCGRSVAQVETSRRRKDGAMVDVSITLSPIRDNTGRVIAASGIVRDVTERKRVENVLRESEERYRTLVENIDMGITLIDQDHRIVMVNEGHARMFKRTATECIGQECFRLFEGREKVCPHCPGVRAMQTGLPVEVETEGVREDGSTFAVSLRAFPVADTSGTPTRFIEIVEDITNRKRTQEELNTAKQAAEAANRSKSEFLANMSHEIRTPMTAILGFADILVSNSATEESTQSAQIIKRNGEHLLNVINDILDLSKIEAGKCTVALQDSSPQQVAAEVIALMKVRADAKELPLTLEVGGDVPEKITTDPIRLRQVLVNLIGNAIKFTEAGSVRLAMRMDRTTESEARLIFDVIDTGIGISEEQIGVLFQPFSQVDGSAGRRFGGTGLGLAISKRLAEMLGGDISVRSILGHGSTFSLSVGIGCPDGLVLPQVPSPTVSTGGVVSNSPQKLDCQILLAEDGPDNQRLIAFLLRKAGAEVAIADNGQIALDLALAAHNAGSPYGLVLMDMQMPVMDGYEATRRLRSAGYEEPILALTAHAMTEDRQKCLDAGCNDYITKPIDSKKLIGLLQAWVAGQTLV